MDIQELKKQLDYLEETKQLIKEQLVAKGQPVDENTTFREYVDNMNDLVDTTDANAIEGDLALDKTAYVNGQKITGTLETTDAISIDNSNNTDTHLTLMNMGNIPSMVVGANINDLYGVRKIVEDGTSLEIIAPQSQIANVISLTADKIKAGETILGITGNVVELNGDTETVTPTTSQQIITPTSPKNALTQVTVNAVTSAIDSSIKTENIKSGVTILGVSGKSSVVDTSDANAVANDIVNGKTAYVNGSKITGDLTTYGSGEKFEQTISMTAAYDSVTNMLLLGSNPGQCAFKGGTIELSCSGNTIATSANITANKIAMGETVLGIVGTYMGTAMKEYASVTDMNNDIANISEGELVKVVESGATSYFIKETIDNVPTMTKLVKESETMSPQEYEDANDIADEILGE